MISGGKIGFNRLDSRLRGNDENQMRTRRARTWLCAAGACSQLSVQAIYCWRSLGRLAFYGKRGRVYAKFFGSVGGRAVAPMSAAQPPPEVVVMRLPLYMRALTQLRREGKEVVSSQQLGERLRMTPAQIRKDLSYFGRFGKQGRGYSIRFLLDELREILGLNAEWRACLVGVGRLGRAIINYTGFAPEGFAIVAAFDSSEALAGDSVGGLAVRPMSDLPFAVNEMGVTIGIVAVPAAQAQSVIDTLVRSGVRGILNYAPVAPYVPPGIVVRNIDPALSLQSMTFYLKGGG